MSRHVSEDELNENDNNNNEEEQNVNDGNNSSVEMDGDVDNSVADGDDNENEDGSGDEEAEEEEENSSRSRKRGRPAGRGRTVRAKRDKKYRIYIFKTLKQIHPKIGITKTGMDIVNSFVEDMFERLCTEAMKLSSSGKKRTSTISVREIKTAAKLSIP